MLNEAFNIIYFLLKNELTYFENESFVIHDYLHEKKNF